MTGDGFMSYIFFEHFWTLLLPDAIKHFWLSKNSSLMFVLILQGFAVFLGRLSFIGQHLTHNAPRIREVSPKQGYDKDTIRQLKTDMNLRDIRQMVVSVFFNNG